MTTPSEDLLARRLHPISPVLDLLAVAARSWPLIPVLVLSDLWLLVVVAYPLIVLAARVLGWRCTTWAFEGGTLRVERGVLQRSVRLAPADRVQQVEVVRRLRHQVFGVAAVHVELAGGGAEPKIVLEALSLADARRLQAALERRRLVARTADLPAGAPLPPPAAAREVVRLSGTLLALGGLTGPALLAAPAFALWVLDVLGDLRVGPEEVLPTDGPSAAQLTVGAVLLGAGWLAVAAGVEVVRQRGFTLEQVPSGDICIRRGLLERRMSTVPVVRVQSVVVRANLVRRALGLCRVRVRTAAPVRTDGPNDLQPGVPVLRRSALPTVLDVFVPGAGRPPVWQEHPPAARRRAVVRRALASTATAGALAWVAGPGALIAVPVALAVGVGWGRAAHTQRSHAVEAGMVHSRAGVLSWRHAVVPIARVQTVRLTASPGQRRHALVTLHLDLAGGRSSVAVRDLGRDRAIALARLVTAQPPAPQVRTGWAAPVGSPG